MRVGGLPSVLGAVLATAALASCASAEPVPIRIQNDTSVPVGLYVGGSWVGTYPPGAGSTVAVDRQLDPPVTVELRSPSDAILLRLTANEGAIEAARTGGYGVGESLGLPCGVLTALVGTLRPDEELAPAPSVQPGPCP
jgi:hypothetical protein